MSGSVEGEAASEAGPDAPGADVIVVAAGASRRMGGADKLAANVAGRPLLAWTLDAVAAARSVERIVLVVAPDRVASYQGATWLPQDVAAVVAGGERRQDSAYAGLRALDALDREDDRVVLVHDGARPLVSASLVDAVAAAASKHGAAIPAVTVADTVKRMDGGLVVETVDRSNLATAQTPQGARRGLLRRAFEALAARPDLVVTDEAALLELSAIPVVAVPGEPANVKVTLPADLDRVAAILGGPTERRTGIGTDRHAFGPEMTLHLGGVAIDRAPRLFGHSDGDAALHAIVNAMLGAVGRGDIGRLFPADARTPRGIDSGEMVREARRIVETAGWRIASVNLAIEGARPRLGSHLDAMAAAIAGLLAIETAAVGVSASTGNLSSVEGAGRAISATALVNLARRELR